MRVRFKNCGEDQTGHMTAGNEYEVICIESGSYRIVSDEKEPYLYDPHQFEVIDSVQPDFWVTEIDEDGDLNASPMAWFHGYFFEDYFDNKPGIRERFWSDCKRLYGISKDA